jgi:16S rRNA (guanine966-N2)-methyltransferase
MRVIAGEHRGRKIAAPPGRTTRPTPERVREALFSALESRLGGPGSLQGIQVLDLFAGTGALGIEALSRGAVFAAFVEKDPAALRRLRSNLEELNLLERARILPGEVRGALQALSRSSQRFDAVFLDPPYGDADALAALRDLAQSGLVRPGGVAIFEHAARSQPLIPAEWVRERTRTYGTVAITVLSPGQPPVEGVGSRPENAT